MLFRTTWPSGNLFDRLEQMRREMDRLYGTLEGGVAPPAAGVYPAMNVTQDADNFYVRAELPGIKADDLEISAVRNKLEISGKRELPVEENASYHRRERAGGAFRRSITLPTDINPDGVEAQYKNGVLAIALPRAEDKKPRKVAVKTK